MLSRALTEAPGALPSMMVLCEALQVHVDQRERSHCHRDKLWQLLFNVMFMGPRRLKLQRSVEVHYVFLSQVLLFVNNKR